MLFKRILIYTLNVAQGIKIIQKPDLKWFQNYCVGHSHKSVDYANYLITNKCVIRI